MAPIYTAKHTSASDKTTPLFSLKGLKNLAPTPISSCGIHGVPLERQVAYTQYTDNLGSFIHASVTNTRVSIGNRAYGYLESKRHLPLTPPPVHLTLQKELQHEQSEKFLRLLGSGAMKVKVGKTTIYQAPALPYDVLHKILPIATTHFNSGRDAINPMGRKAFEFISSCFAEILRVHSYSAFTMESKETIVELRSLLCADSMEYGKFDKKNEKIRVEQSRYLTDLLQASNVDEGGMAVDEDDDEDPLKERLFKAAGYLSGVGNDIVTVAKPPKEHIVNIGPSSSVPSLPGILFPYFTGLCQPDSMSLTSFVARHLFQLLGSTVQECQDTYAALRRGFNSLSTTDVGMELAHIGFGIDLALRTQGRCYVIIDTNRYQGFCLLGARLAVFDSSKWVGAYDEEDLAADLAQIDPHVHAVATLSQMFSELSANSLYKGPIVSKETFAEPRSLIPVFSGVEFEQLGDLEPELNRHLRCLNYMGPGYLSRNPQALAEVLETYFSESTIELARPTYISSIRAPIASRGYAMLSRFGPEAPSLWNDRGQEFQCVARETPSSTAPKRKMGELDTYANMPIRLLVSSKPLEIATRDLEKVVDKGVVRMDLKERAGKNRNMSVEAEEMRKRIWKTLVTGLNDPKRQKRSVPDRGKAPVSEHFDDLMSSLLGD